MFKYLNHRSFWKWHRTIGCLFHGKTTDVNNRALRWSQGISLESKLFLHLQKKLVGVSFYEAGPFIPQVLVTKRWLTIFNMQHPRWLKKVLTKSPCRLCQNVVRFFLVLTCHVIVNSLYLFSGKWEMNYSWQVKVYLFENEDFIYQFTRFVLSLTGAYWTMLELIKIQLLMYFFTLGTIWK